MMRGGSGRLFSGRNLPFKRGRLDLEIQPLVQELDGPVDNNQLKHIFHPEYDASRRVAKRYSA
jgi:hypothetical protein